MCHHRIKSGGQRHCASGDKMVLVCYVILESHVIKALKSTITAFSKAHGISYTHMQNIIIKLALTKTFASVTNDSSLILVTSSCVTNDEICAKKTFVGPSKKSDWKGKKEKEKKKGSCKAF